MHIEQVTLKNFRCFGPEPTTIDLDAAFTVFVGTNGTGKTAAFAALGRMFGVTRGDRQVVPEDFHIPVGEAEAPNTRELSIEAVIAFPELIDGGGEESTSVPEFFRQMAANEDGHLKCRFRLDATWTDDGSVDGTVEESLVAIRTFEENYGADDCNSLRAMDRTRIQMVYLPASRDGAHHLASFLRSRLWRAAKWTPGFRSAVAEAADDLGTKFQAEPAVEAVEEAVRGQWRSLHRGAFDADPAFHPIDQDISQLVNKAQLMFTPNESGSERTAGRLSDGQRSLLHIALTAATIEIEASIASGLHRDKFDEQAAQPPSLTLLVVEEPENGLSPHFLSRIVSQMGRIGGRLRAQSLASSQSAGVLGRVDPRQVRHFRIDPGTGAAAVKPIRLPDSTQEEAAYVRGAVQAYPELYFAQFVVLCEGSSEEIVIPMLARARDVEIDQSFVSVVPLGGRHAGHFWRLLDGLEIPHVTLLDLDFGRAGGGKGRLKTACRELERIGKKPLDGLGQFEGVGDLDGLGDSGPGDSDFDAVVEALEEHGVVFCSPLDLDMSMLQAFPTAYKELKDGKIGPKGTPAFEAVLGPSGDFDAYRGMESQMRWYRYLFVGGSKPTAHLLALQQIGGDTLCADMPRELDAVISKIAGAVVR